MPPRHRRHRRPIAQLVVAMRTVASAACANDASSPVAEPVVEPVVVTFDRMWATVDREYPYFDFRGIDWQAVRRQFRPRALRATTTADLVAIVHEARGALRDAHVWLLAPGGGAVPTYQPDHRRNGSPAILAQLQQRTGWVSASEVAGGVVVDGVPVLVLTSFASGQLHLRMSIACSSGTARRRPWSSMCG